jgi:glycosyltransferase involved in cell wall biosynthesis
MSKLVTVALINGGGEFDGTTIGLKHYPSALAESGFRVTWYQCLDYGSVPYRPTGSHPVKGLGFPNATIDMGINRLWVYPHRLRDLHEDVVFLSDPTMLGVGRRRRARVVKVHDLRPLTPHADRRLTTVMFRHVLPQLRTIERIITPTHALAAELAGRGIGLDRIRVVPDTPDLGDHPHHLATSTARIRDGGTLRVLCVATDRPYKNVGFAIRLARMLRPASVPSRFQFTIVSQLRPETRGELIRAGPDTVRVIPRAASMAEVYAEQDVLVHPSLYEGFGRPVLEAMSFGIPVVVNRIPSLAEVVGDAGILLDVRSIGSWVEALNSLTDPSTFERWGRKALDRSRDYSPERFRTAVREAFEGV